ncbi:MAG: hypothetical protein ABSC94_17535 [Polyangiaceae bacterium]|jgi:hypothetical protein
MSARSAPWLSCSEQDPGAERGVQIGDLGGARRQVTAEVDRIATGEDRLLHGFFHGIS